MNKKIPTAVGMLILIAGLIGGVILVNSRTSLQTKAGPTESPKNIKITNRGSNSVSISWTTDIPMTGYIRYSEDPGKITTPAGDVRDQISGTSQAYTSHYVNITGLNPNKQYYFNIGSGSQTYNDNGKPFQFKTHPSLSSPQEDVVFGKIVSGDGAPVNGAIVFLDIQDSETLSAITKNDGGWRINLSSSRTKDGKVTTIDPKNTVLSIFVQAGTNGTATAITNTEKARPVPDIITGKNQAFVESAGAILSDSGSSRSGQFALTETQLSASETITKSLELLTGDITFLNPAIEGELIATTSPEFKIKVSTGSAIVLKVGEQLSKDLLPNQNGEYSWSPPETLTKGINTLEVTYVDNTNQEKKVMRTFNVLAVGDISGLPAFTATPSATIELTPTPAPTEATTMPETDGENLEDAGSLQQIATLALVGLILIVGGNVLKKKWQ